MGSILRELYRKIVLENVLRVFILTEAVLAKKRRLQIVLNADMKVLTGNYTD